MDVRHEDVLIVASLILVDREAEADDHQFVPGEAAGGRIAQHRTGVLVGVFPAKLLQQDVALLHLPAFAPLTLHSEGLALLHHSHDFSFHNALAHFSFLLQFMLRLNKNLQTVKLKYMLIVLVFTSRLLATFVVDILLCREEARGPRRRNDGSEKTSTASGPRWSQLTVQRYGNLSCPTKF